MFDLSKTFLELEVAFVDHWFCHGCGNVNRCYNGCLNIKITGYLVCTIRVAPGQFNGCTQEIFDGRYPSKTIEFPPTAEPFQAISAKPYLNSYCRLNIFYATYNCFVISSIV